MNLEPLLFHRAVKLSVISFMALSLISCGFFGEGDNAPPVFDSPDEQAARAERRAESPGRKIHGKMYQFIDATIHGKISVPTSSAFPVLTLEEGMVKGFDGCASFRGRGIFTPSGYEYTMRDSEPFKSPDVICASGEARWAPVKDLNGRVWKLDLKADGTLVLIEYNKGTHVFRLRSR